jgi:predicted membrane channel-forming protein YqfA (hemolysin III family)
VTILASVCSYATIDTKFRTPKFRPYRAAMYAGLGLSAIIFIIHGLLIHGWETQKHRMSLNWMALMATFNLIGAAAYAARVRRPFSPKVARLDKNRFRRDGALRNMISMAAVTSSYIVWLFVLVWHITSGYSRPLTTCMGRAMRVARAVSDITSEQEVSRQSIWNVMLQNRISHL